MTGKKFNFSSLRPVVAEFEGVVHEWRKKNFGTYTFTGQFWGMVEELGELAHVLLKSSSKIRISQGDIELLEKDAIGDLFIFLLGYTTARDLDLVDCIELAWDDVRQRDWVKYPMNGRTA